MSIRAQLEALVAKQKAEKEAAAQQGFCITCEEELASCYCDSFEEAAAHE